LAHIPGLILETPIPVTNMVFVRLSDDISITSQQIAARLLVDHKVKVGTVGPRRFRMVTHYWIDDEGVERTLHGLGQVL
jgi:threonine aldolase